MHITYATEVIGAMSVQLQDQYNDPIISPTLGAFSNGLAQLPPSLASGDSGDTISRFLNPWSQSGSYGDASSSGSGNSMSSIITQLLAVISSLMSQSGLSNMFGSTGSTGNSGWPQSNEQYFSSASGGSNGDPHLSFNGSTWNDMQSEGDLLRSDSVPGGYRLSTQTTTPNANGVTYNAQATVTTDHGRTSVTLDNNGNASYTQDGTTNTIADGQTINLGNGETVTRSQNGALTITNTTPSGGNITTTLSENGRGVDANVTASNVDLAGTLVNGSTPTPPPQPQPTSPIAPHPTPIRMTSNTGW